MSKTNGGPQQQPLGKNNGSLFERTICAKFAHVKIEKHACEPYGTGGYCYNIYYCKNCHKQKKEPKSSYEDWHECSLSNV